MSETPSVTMSRVKIAAAKQERPGQEADEGGDDGAGGEPEEGVGEAVACENGRGVGA